MSYAGYLNNLLQPRAIDNSGLAALARGAGAISTGYQQMKAANDKHLDEQIDKLGTLAQIHSANGDKSQAYDAVSQMMPLLNQRYDLNLHGPAEGFRKDVGTDKYVVPQNPTVQQTVGSPTGAYDVDTHQPIMQGAGNDYSPVQYTPSGGAVPTNATKQHVPSYEYNMPAIDAYARLGHKPELKAVTDGTDLVDEDTNKPAYINQRTGKVTVRDLGDKVAVLIDGKVDHYEDKGATPYQQWKETTRFPWEQDVAAKKLDQGDRRIAQGDQRLQQGSQRLDMLRQRYSGMTNRVTSAWTAMNLKVATGQQRAYQQAEAVGRHIQDDIVGIPDKAEREAFAKSEVARLKGVADQEAARQRGIVAAGQPGGQGGQPAAGSGLAQQMVGGLRNLADRAQAGKAQAPAR